MSTLIKCRLIRDFILVITVWQSTTQRVNIRLEIITTTIGDLVVAKDRTFLQTENWDTDQTVRMRLYLFPQLLIQIKHSLQLHAVVDPLLINRRLHALCISLTRGSFV